MSTLGDNCTSSCITRDHATWGDCLRSKSLRVGWCREAAGFDKTKDNKFHAEIKAYRDAARQGIEPDGSSMRQIRAAVEFSEATGIAYKSNV